MVNKGVVLHWLTDKEIPFGNGKKKSADLLAESIAILNGLYFLGVLSALYYIKEVDYTIALHALSVLVLSAFIALFLSIWPKTRSQKGMGENNYEDPSFLVLAIVLTIWNTMLILKTGEGVQLVKEGLPKYKVWMPHILKILDILNSSFFLLAALQFDFDQNKVNNEDGLKKIVTQARNWLNKKSRVTKLTAISLFGYVLLVGLHGFGLLLKIQGVKIWMLPVVLFSLFTILILGTFLEQLYRERKFGWWLRRSVTALMFLAACLTLLDYFEASNIPEHINLLAQTFYRFGLAAVFLLLAFSLKDKIERSLRSSLLHAETQSTHFMKEQIDVILKEVQILQKQNPVSSEKLDHLYAVLEAVGELNKLIFSYRATNIKGYSLFDNFQTLTRQLSSIFYYWTNNKIQSRIDTTDIDWNYLKTLDFSPQQQLDLLRLITELCLNGSSAYSSGNFPPGKIKIKANAGKTEDKHLAKLVIIISNDAPASDDDLKKINTAFKTEVTPKILSERSEQIYMEEHSDTEQQGHTKATSTSLGLYVVTAICQVNGWDIESLESNKGVSVQIYIPLN